MSSMNKIQNFVTKCYVNSNVLLNSNLLQDLLMLAKIIAYAIFSFFEILFRNILPATYLNKNIKGDVVCITGAAGGLGKYLTQKFLNLGCIVVCIDINEKVLKNLQDYLNEAFATEPDSIRNRMYFYKIDLSKINEIKTACSLIKKEVGKIDIIINNAGVTSGSKTLMALSDEDILKTFNVNVLSQFWLCREFLPDMIRCNKGHIVNVSSVCGVVGGYKLTDYCSSKFAVTGFTESLRVELSVLNPKNRIKVSLVCPSLIKTKMFNGADIVNFKFLNLNLEPENVADEIIQGILLNKEMIYLPKINYFFFVIKYIIPTKAMDFVQYCFDFHGSMDRMKKIE